MFKVQPSIAIVYVIIAVVGQFFCESLLQYFFLAQQITYCFQACCGMIDTSHALQMGQVMAAWDRVGLKAEEAAKNKNSTNAMPS
jgi:hypothetical protein